MAIALHYRSMKRGKYWAQLYIRSKFQKEQNRITVYNTIKQNWSCHIKKRICCHNLAGIFRSTEIFGNEAL